MFAGNLGHTRGMDAGLERLRAKVLARRAELGLSQEEVAALGGPSTTTQSKLTNCEAGLLRRGTLRAFDLALSWEAGSAQRILDGGDEIPLDTADGPDLGPEKTHTIVRAVGVSLKFSDTLVEVAFSSPWDSEGQRSILDVEDVVGAAYEARRAFQKALSDMQTTAFEQYAARRGYSQRARLDHHADTLGEESQDPGGFE